MTKKWFWRRLYCNRWCEWDEWDINENCKKVKWNLTGNKNNWIFFILMNEVKNILLLSDDPSKRLYFYFFK